MATLSLREIAESQLNETPVIDGQLVCCLDTGRFYRDTGSSRVELEVDIICVSSLPLAPITDKFYLVVPDTLYFYDGTDFNLLTHPNVIEAIQENGADLDINDKTVNITVPTKVSELENDEGFISQDTNTTYTLKSSKSSENGDVIVELENSDGGSDILQVVGDGITTVTTDANGIITITSTEEENENTYAEAPYDNGPASRVVIDDGEMTVDSTFYLPFISESDSTLLSNDGILYNTFTSEYDADTIARLGEGVLGKMLLGSVGYYNGYATLVLGNNIPSGTAGNKYGAVQIYSSLANYWTLYGNKEATSNYMLFMPTATGCLVVAPDQTQVGDETTPIYITSDGMATTFNKTIGSSNQPVYMNRGAITAMDSPLSTIYGGTGTSLGHMEIGFGEDTESSIAPGAGETFTVIDEVTRDYFGHVTSLNTKTILLPVSSFSDTKVTQELTSESATYPVLLAPAGQTGTSTTSAYFGTKIQANPGTGALTATSFIGNLTGNADTATTADVAELIGTGTVGSELNPIYILNGSPTASTATIGGIAQPTFFNNGVVAPITASVGDVTQPVYLNNGVITAMSGTLAVEYGGTGTKNGHINIVFDDDTDSSETLNPGESFTVIDDVTRDNYGHITKVNVKTILLSGVGFADTKVTQELTSKSDDYPILLAPAGQSATTTTSAYFGTEFQANPSTGELIAKTFVGNLSGNADSATTATNADVAAKVGTINVGSDATPIYIVGGTPTAISDTIGSSAQPVYLNSGAITPIYDSIGSSSQPVYLDGGVIKPIGTLSAIYGGTGTTTGHIKVDSLTINSSSTTLEFGGDFEVIDSITRDDFGHITAYNVDKLSMPHDSVGNGTNFVYFNGGVPTASSSTVGAVNKPIWMNGGTIKEITNPISIALGGTGTDTGHCSVSVSNYTSDDSKTVALGGIIQSVSDVTRDEYGHVLYYALDTITLSQTIPLTLTNPSAETTYYMPFSEKSEDVLRYNDGITYTTYSPEYDSNTGAILGSAILGKMLLGSNGYNDGYALLTLGNNTSYGIAGNKYGELRLYGAGTKYWTINGSKRTTSDYVLFLPESNGCLVVAHDGEKTGDDVTPVYIADNGEVTASLGTVGSVEQPVYLNNGTITAITGTVGSAEQPVYLNKGIITAITANVGSETNPVYFSDGIPIASKGTVGSAMQPIWMNNGIIAAFDQTIGDVNHPIYLNSGVMTEIPGNVVYYGVSDTANSSTSKTATCEGFKLITGSRVSILFNNNNSASSITLNVNNTGSKSIVGYGSTISSCLTWSAGSIVEFIYDGTNWVYLSPNNGINCIASGLFSHVEGNSNTASGASSHAEGNNTEASGNYSHAEGYQTEASGDYSHAEGYQTEASGDYAHSEGRYSIASGDYTHVAGVYTESHDISETVIGQFNTISDTDGARLDNSLGNVLVAGGGYGYNGGVDERDNAFRVAKDGMVYARLNYNSYGADYAEFIKEWYDGNPENEDRVGYFVTIKDEFLYKAEDGDYIVGITSGNPSIVGNSDENYYWRYERDEFNRVIYEDIEEEIEATDDNGNIMLDDNGDPIFIKTGKVIKNARFKQSEDYDPTQKYIERKDRQEWDYVGMIGTLPVRDDGTCEPGKYCKCGTGGIATLATERGFDTYYVVERVSNSVISVILK